MNPVNARGFVAQVKAAYPNPVSACSEASTRLGSYCVGGAVYLYVIGKLPASEFRTGFPSRYTLGGVLQRLAGMAEAVRIDTAIYVAGIIQEANDREDFDTAYSILLNFLEAEGI